MSILERAIAIAAEAHAGTFDKADEPYILHILRVMHAGSTVEERIAGALHDLIEDCPGWTFERLREEGFSDAVVAAVDALTRREGERYMTFVRRAAADPIARRVKRADLVDNSNLTRIAKPTARDRARLKRYEKALAYIDGLESG